MEAHDSDHAEQPLTRNARRRLGRSNMAGTLSTALARVRQLEAEAPAVTTSNSSHTEGTTSQQQHDVLIRIEASLQSLRTELKEDLQSELNAYSKRWDERQAALAILTSTAFSKTQTTVAGPFSQGSPPQGRMSLF